MVLVDFRSNPLNANVTRIGSVTPEEIKLIHFRDICVSNGTINVGWNKLRPFMSNRTVSDIWWLLTEKERRSILQISVPNELYYYVSEMTDGQENCGGAFNNWTKAWCRNNTTMKLHIFGKPVTDNSKSFYYKANNGQIYCYYRDDYYDLPYYYVAFRTPIINGEREWAHAVSGVLVNQDTSTYNSWVFFQYSYYDFKPGHSQIPTDKYDLTMYIYKYTDLPGLDKIRYSREHTFEL